jgi:O-antigen/teichoic acid export membrane protein
LNPLSQGPAAIASSLGAAAWTSHKFIRDVLFANLPGPFQRLRACIWLVVFSYSMGMAAVGAWALFDMTLTLSISLATLLLGHAMMRFLSGTRSPQEASAGFSSVLGMVVVSGLVVGGGVAILAGPLARPIFHGGDGRSLMLIVAAALVFECVYEESRGFLRSRRENRNLAVVTLARLLPETAVTVGVALVARSIVSTAFAYLVCAILAAGGAVLFVKNEAGLRLMMPERAILKRYLSFSLPLMPGTMASVAAARLDRYVLAYFLSLREVGTYSICFTVAGLAPALVAPIGDVLFPELSDLYETARWDAFYARFAGVQKFILAVVLGAVALLLAFPREALRLVTPAAYAEGASTLALLGIRGVFMVALTFYGMLLSLRLKVWCWTAIYAAMGAVVVLLDLLLVPWAGIRGAAVSQLVATALGAIAVITIEWEACRRSFASVWLVPTGAAFGAVCLPAWLMRAGELTLARSVLRLFLGGGVYLAALFLTGYFGREDLRPFRDALRARESAGTRADT